ncbi:hypothetical protein CATRI_01420 [Corynebacterium atrinae]|nr:hypothetical protein CATRI_01420 [Corynebacterium atrinae]
MNINAIIEQIIVAINTVLGQAAHMGSSASSNAALALGLI